MEPLKITEDSAREMTSAEFTLGYIGECLRIAKAAMTDGDWNWALQQIQLGIDAKALYMANRDLLPVSEVN
jgi:hypothetical protein